MISEVIIAALVLLNCRYVESSTNPLTMEGGNDTNISYQKFMALIYVDQEHFVGFIISKKLVLTCFPCIYGTRVDQITVHVGSPTGGRNYSISHKNYTDSISVLVLKETLTFDNTIGAIAVPIKDIGCLLVGTKIKVLGFGEGGSKIQEVNLEIVNETVCLNVFGPPSSVFWRCASSHAKLSKEDRGGPVLYGDKLIGILKLALKERPNVILNVAIVNYIQEIMRQHP